MRMHLGIGPMLALVLGLAVPGWAVAQEGGAAKAEKDLALRGDAVCTRCHDEESAVPEILRIGRTKHGTTADLRTPTCTSCHGESPTHIDKPEGVEERPKTDVVFGKGSTNSATEQNARCLACHQGGERVLWVGSTHEQNDVACSSCHQVHSDHDKARDKQAQTEVCFACHKEQRAQINRPYRHPIPEGMVSCSNCHNPHGSNGPALMVRHTVNDTCYQCHMEKRGPFLWNHQPVTEDCALCHDPHGTTIENLLKWRRPFLCEQCHEPSSHRGSVAQAGEYYTAGRGCANCHTNVHGGNNSLNDSGSRSFRR